VKINSAFTVSIALPQILFNLFPEFSIKLVEHLVGVGLGDAQLLGHFLHARKVLYLH